MKTAAMVGIALILGAAPLLGCAQIAGFDEPYTPDVEWTTGFYSDSVWADGVAVDSHNDAVVLGTFSGAFEPDTEAPYISVGPYEAFLLKLDQEGGPVWSERLTSDAGVSGSNIAANDEGDIAVLGQFSAWMRIQDTTLTTPYTDTLFVATFSPDGQLAWVNPASIAQDMFDAEVAIDSDGDVVVVGTSWRDAWTYSSSLVKFSHSGAYLWEHNLLPDCDDCSMSIVDMAMAPHGDIAVIGDLYQGFDPMNDVSDPEKVVARFSSTGDYEWKTSIPWADEVAFDKEGNVIVAGSFLSDSIRIGDELYTRVGYRDTFVAKLSSSGDPLWAHTKGAEGTYRFVGSMKVDTRGNVVLMESVQYPLTDDPTMYSVVRRYAASGAPLGEMSSTSLPRVEAGFPRMAVNRLGDLVVAWRANGDPGTELVVTQLIP